MNYSSAVSILSGKSYSSQSSCTSSLTGSYDSSGKLFECFDCHHPDGIESPSNLHGSKSLSDSYDDDNGIHESNWVEVKSKRRLRDLRKKKLIGKGKNIVVFVPKGRQNSFETADVVYMDSSSTTNHIPCVSSSYVVPEAPSINVPSTVELDIAKKAGYAVNVFINLCDSDMVLTESIKMIKAMGGCREGIAFTDGAFDQTSVVNCGNSHNDNVVMNRDENSVVEKSSLVVTFPVLNCTLDPTST